MKKYKKLEEAFKKSKLTVDKLNNMASESACAIAVAELDGKNTIKARKTIEDTILTSLLVLEGMLAYGLMDVKEEKKLSKLRKEIGYDQAGMLEKFIEFAEEQYGKEED